MPALVNNNVGSLRGTRGEEATISCPSRLKKSRNCRRMSLAVGALEVRVCITGPIASKSAANRAFRPGGGTIPVIFVISRAAARVVQRNPRPRFRRLEPTSGPPIGLPALEFLWHLPLGEAGEPVGDVEPGKLGI